MPKVLTRTRGNHHIQQRLEGGRFAEATFYPMPLVKAMICGMFLRRDVDRISWEEMEEQRSSINAITKSSAEIQNTPDQSVRTSKMTEVDGAVMPIPYNPCQFRPKHVDAYTGELIDPSLISDAIIEALEHFNGHVWCIENKATMLGIKGHMFVPSRWVMCNKCDHIEPDMRARLVACGVNKERNNDIFHAFTLDLKPRSCCLLDMHQSAPKSVNC